MTKLVLVAAVVTVVVTGSMLAGPTVAAAGPGHVDSFMNPPPSESAYATAGHLGYSWRATLIYWLGGATITDQRELRRSEREKWWGDSVPLIPADEPARPRR
jgi:hypothetical protein